MSNSGDDSSVDYSAAGAEGEVVNAGQEHHSETPADGFAAMYEAAQKEDAARKQSYSTYVASPNYERDLLAAHEAVTENPEFAAGQLVQWKTFLRAQAYPDYGAPAIVIGPLGDGAPTHGDVQVYPEHDILLGVLDGDQDFLIFSAASSRLMPWDSGSRSAEDLAAEDT